MITNDGTEAKAQPSPIADGGRFWGRTIPRECPRPGPHSGPLVVCIDLCVFRCLGHLKERIEEEREGGTTRPDTWILADLPRRP